MQRYLSTQDEESANVWWHQGFYGWLMVAALIESLLMSSLFRGALVGGIAFWAGVAVLGAGACLWVGCGMSYNREAKVGQLAGRLPMAAERDVLRIGREGVGD